MKTINTNNSTKNIEKVEKAINKKGLHFRNNLDVVNEDNVKVFQVRNCTNKANIYATLKEYEMMKDVVDIKKVAMHDKAKKPYVAINNVSLDELNSSIDRVMIAKGMKKGKKA